DGGGVISRLHRFQSSIAQNTGRINSLTQLRSNHAWILARYVTQLSQNRRILSHVKQKTSKFEG
ncbi:MAG: hypothetical protein IJJ21_05130, partial [Firmicutes bacterium]|nr:hypothetical protein [Bacillota bacterium]